MKTISKLITFMLLSVISLNIQAQEIELTNVSNSFFKTPKTYSIKQYSMGGVKRTYERGESLLIIDSNSMTTKWKDGSGSTTKLTPKNISIFEHEQAELAYVSDDGREAVQAIKSQYGTVVIYIYAYNKPTKKYGLIGIYGLYGLHNF